MKARSLRFHLSLALVALSGLGLLPDAQAATPRSDIARPTDFLPQAADASMAACKSSELMTCGRQAASRLKPPAGSGPKSAYRFAEEQFLFDSGVGIFLQTAVAASKGADAPMEWRRRLAFKRGADGRFQLVQIGIQYRCGSGSWQKTACAPRAVARAEAKASGQRGAAAVSGAAAAGVGASVGAAGAPAGGTAGAAAQKGQAAGSGVRPPAAATPGAAPAVEPAVVPPAPVDSPSAAGVPPVASPVPQSGGAEENPRLDARWRPMRGDDIRSESVSPEDEARARALAGSGRADAGQAGGLPPGQREGAMPGTASADVVSGTGGRGGAARAGDAVTGAAGAAAGGAAAAIGTTGARGAATGAASGGAAQTGRAVGGAAPAWGERAGRGADDADIVAAKPALSEEELRALQDESVQAGRAAAGGAAAGRHHQADGTAFGGASGDHAAVGTSTARDEAGMGNGAAADAQWHSGARQAGAALGGEAGADAHATGSQPGAAARMADTAAPAPNPVQGNMKLEPTTPDSVRHARGFSPLVPTTEKIARMSQLCEQPIDMCGKTIFDELFKPETFDELLPVQVQRERFIYADGPVVSAVYLVTTVNLPDAVLAAERIRIEFVRRGAGWVAVAAGRQVRCRRGNQGIGNWADTHCG